jgi:hypothetical protein
MALQPPHINILLNAPLDGGKRTTPSTFWTSSGGEVVNQQTVVDAANVLNAIIDACRWRA